MKQFPVAHGSEGCSEGCSCALSTAHVPSSWVMGTLAPSIRAEHHCVYSWESAVTFLCRHIPELFLYLSFVSCPLIQGGKVQKWKSRDIDCSTDSCCVTLSMSPKLFWPQSQHESSIAILHHLCFTKGSHIHFQLNPLDQTIEMKCDNGDGNTSKGWKHNTHMRGYVAQNL